MQDSLQDYLQIAQNVRMNNISLSHTAVAKAIEDANVKKQCDARAQKVVEFLIEGKLQPAAFLRSLDFIDVRLYEDVVDERSITSLCGYPLCGHKLPEMPKKKYLISSKVNKVYDITERKKYCSNFCYNASCHIKEQIDDSPLWLRQLGTHSSYKLLDNAKSGLTPGEEIVHTMEDLNEEPSFTSISDFAAACLNAAEDDEEFHKFDSTSKHHAPMKSILKKRSFTDEFPPDNILPSDSSHSKVKKVYFQDETCEIPNETIQSRVEQQRDLNESINSLCKSLNIKLDFNVDARNTRQQPETPDIHIDEEKMQNIVEKIAKSEEKRNKPIKLIAPPTISFPHSETVLNPPKYAKKLLGIIERSSDNAKQLNTDNVQLNSEIKPKTSKNDIKMQQVIDKIKRKRSQPNAEQKSAILIETVTNPEVQTEKNRLLERELKKQTQDMLNGHLTRLTNDELDNIRKAFRSWFTIETFLYIYGECKLKQVMNPEKLEEYLQKLKVQEDNVSQELEYREICNKLQMMEVASEKFDEECLIGHKERLNPLPDYKQLQCDMKNMDAKVKAFYTRGVYERKADEEREINESIDNEALVAPEVSKNVLRRNIFSKSLMKFVRNDMILDETLPQRLQELIKTFKFEANNITFVPGQWSIIALILITCLYKKDELFEHQLNQQSFKEYINSIVKESINLAGFLEEIRQLIDNVDDFFQTYL